MKSIANSRLIASESIVAGKIINVVTTNESFGRYYKFIHDVEYGF
jgi:hypothetical protein